MTTFTVSIIGMGYVGLCTAVGFASKGNKVVTVDNNQEKVSSINNGISPFYEPGLDDLLQKSVKKGYLACISDIKKAIQQSEITFISVGTPSKTDGSIDLKQIQDSVIEVGKALKTKNGYHLIIVKSTVARNHRLCGKATARKAFKQKLWIRLRIMHEPGISKRRFCRI